MAECRGPSYTAPNVGTHRPNLGNIPETLQRDRKRATIVEEREVSLVMPSMEEHHGQPL